VQLVIADTSPINYPLLIGHIDVLPAVFQEIVLPGTVRNELSHPKAPRVVRDWIANPPAWVKICPVTGALGVLNRAAQRQLINLTDAFDRPLARFMNIDQRQSPQPTTNDVD
jgi:predicted nucleic acid-binding protein